MNQKTYIVKSLTKEERDLLYFSEPVGYHVRLQQYWEYPQSFAARTTASKGGICLSTTKTFRCYLRRFIRNFQPEALWPDGNLWLHLEKNGRFALRLGVNGEEITDFSKVDFYTFQYMCFLHVRRFWTSLRRCNQISLGMLPVFIQDFSELLEQGDNYDVLLQRALSNASQVVAL